MRIKWGLGLPGPFFLTGGRREGRGHSASALVGLFKLLGFCFVAALILVAIEVAFVVGLILLGAGLVFSIGYGIGVAIQRKKRNDWDLNNWAASQERYRSKRGGW